MIQNSVYIMLQWYVTKGEGGSYTLIPLVYVQITSEKIPEISETGCLREGNHEIGRQE